LRASRVLATGAFLAACLVGGIWAGAREEPTRLTFLSVGQGDCAVFQHRGTTVLVDVGPSNENFDSGERIVAPSLRRLGVKTIDLVLISHPDADHFGGLPAIFRHFNVGKIAMPAHFRRHPAVRAAFAKCGVKEQDVVWVQGERKAIVAGFELRLTAPSWHEPEPDNDGSMFVRISGMGASCVFTGDASSERESIMAGRGEDWRAQVLKAGHHGSSHSSDEAWVDAVHPRFAVLSAGRNNRYGHPAPGVIRRFESHGVRTLRTDRLGDVSFVVGAGGFEPAR
jgi:competence protein ComEC